MPGILSAASPARLAAWAWAPALLLLASACTGGGADEAAPANEAAPRASAAAPAKGPAAAGDPPRPQADEAAASAIPDDPGLATMSPSRRRAYERGYRDCSAGRYDPDPYPESYRIGCGAAEDRKADRRPQG